MTMPLYEYKCRGCGHQYEALVRGGEVPSCPSCKGQDLERLLSAFGMTSKEHTKSLVSAERKRRAPVRRGQAYEEHQAAVKEHDEHRQHFAATKTNYEND